VDIGWLPLEIADVSPSFLLQMLHVKNTNWTLRFGAVASEPADLFNVALANDHKRKAAMDVKVFGLYLYPLSTLFLCLLQRRPAGACGTINCAAQG
jgi:hypothetical protein